MHQYRPGQAADRRLRDALDVVPEDGRLEAFGAALAEALLLLRHGTLAAHVVACCHASGVKGQ